MASQIAGLNDVQREREECGDRSLASGVEPRRPQRMKIGDSFRIAGAQLPAKFLIDLEEPRVVHEERQGPARRDEVEPGRVIKLVRARGPNVIELDQPAKGSVRPTARLRHGLQPSMDLRAGQNRSDPLTNAGILAGDSLQHTGFFRRHGGEGGWLGGLQGGDQPQDLDVLPPRQ
jgi:hypothetical protein